MEPKIAILRASSLARLILLATVVVCDACLPPRVAAQAGGQQPSAGERLARAVRAGDTSTEATALLQESIMRVQREHSIAANIRQKINVYGRELVGAGTYRQVSSGNKVQSRTELKVPMGDTISTLLQICDGRFLWTYRALPHEDSNLGLATKLSRVDLETVDRQLSRSSGLGPQRGGLAGIMQQSLVNFRFDQAHAGTLYQVPVWTMTGEWQTPPPTSESEGEGEDVMEFEHVPDGISITIGAEDLFPYRFEYSKRQTVMADEAGIVPTGRRRCIMSLDFFEVQTGLMIDPQMFHFQPSEVEVTDTTNAYIRNHANSAALR